MLIKDNLKELSVNRDKEMFLSAGHDWGQVINIHSGPAYYMDKICIMSSKKTPKETQGKAFKTMYVEKGLGKLHYKSELKNLTKVFDLESGFSINILPKDTYYIECFQDLFLFESGTSK